MGDAAADVDELARLFFRATLIPVSVQKKNERNPKPKPAPEPEPEPEPESESDPEIDSDQELTILPRAIRKSSDELRKLGIENNMEDLLKQAEDRKRNDAELSSERMNAEGGNVLWYLRKKVLRLRLKYGKQSNGNTPQLKKKEALDEVRRWAYHFVMPDDVLEILFEGQGDENTVDVLRDDNVDLFANKQKGIKIPDDYNSKEGEKDILKKRLLKARIKMFLEAEWRIEDEDRYVPDEWKKNNKPWEVRDVLECGFDADDNDAWDQWMNAMRIHQIRNITRDDHRRLWRNANRLSGWDERMNAAVPGRDPARDRDVFLETFVVTGDERDEITNANNLDLAKAFGDQNNHAQFRREAVNAFSSLNPVFVAQIDRAWTINMSHDGVWADEFAVKSMANALDVCIDVYKEILDDERKTLHFARSLFKPEKDNKFDASKCAPENTIVLLNTGGDLHFDLLTPLRAV